MTTPPNHRPPPLPDLLTPAEADDALRYPRGRSARLARAGKLPHVELPDGSLRFPAADLARLTSSAATVADAADRPLLRLAGWEGVADAR